MKKEHVVRPRRHDANVGQRRLERRLHGLLRVEAWYLVGLTRVGREDPRRGEIRTCAIQELARQPRKVRRPALVAHERRHPLQALSNRPRYPGPQPVGCSG
jgi:hypothetical protein